jgi:pyridoxal phosphate enzyme (YggS family)
MSSARRGHGDVDSSGFPQENPCRAIPAMETFRVEKIAENLERVRSQIADAARKKGRSPDDIELVAISKTHDAEKVRAAYEAGQTLFGESRVQEARAKIPLLPASLRWHFVGHLQKNKIRHALPLFELFHSVDSLALAQEMNRIADEDGMHPRVLVEVNVSGEGSKFGFKPETVRAEMESLLALPRLSIEGLMTIPPFAEEAEASRKFFVQLREFRDALEKEFDMKLPQLSMGMTNDFTVATEEGATLVRVGTAIFGERSKKQKQKATDEHGTSRISESWT